MTSLNTILDTSFHKGGSDDLIELPNPKLINDDTTIIMNGHHNYAMSEEKESGIYIPEEEEAQPFLNHHDINLVSPTSPTGLSIDTDISSNMFPLKESFAGSSPEESEADMEESSTHLLQDQDHVDQSLKCSRTKSKPPPFRSSPSRKQPSDDPHSHIQHRPLELQQDSMPDHFFHRKRACPFSSMTCQLVMLLSLLIIVVLVITLVPSLYFLTTKHCDPTKQWWQGSTIYEIFPASFQDTDGDGFGDMQGLLYRLDYIQNLSIKVIRLNSIFSALDYPLEYEHAIDFANIDPHLGRMEDFQALVRELHSRDMYVILDMNPTATSDQHTWAAHWLLHRPGPFQHFYVNVTEEEGEEPPLEDNPDYTDKRWPTPHRTFGNHLYLNWSNPLLQLEMQSILELWLSLGVDGFYMKHLSSLRVMDMDHIANIVHQWRNVLDKFSANSTRKVLVVSDTDVRTLERHMDPLTFTTVQPVMDVVDASLSLKLNGTDTTMCETVEKVLKFWTQFEYRPQLVWHTGGVETLRCGGKTSGKCHLAFAFLRMVLPGTFSTFYGDEIGIGNSFDPASKEIYRGGQLTPMQWTSGPQANFTTEDATSWLPVHPDYKTRNVASQTEQLEIFSKLVRLKENDKPFIPTLSRSSSLMHTLATRFSNPYENDPPEIYWYHNRCGLVIVQVVETDIHLVANFGTDSVVLGELGGRCTGDHSHHDPADFANSPRINKPFAIILSTNSSLGRMVKLLHVELEPGMAIIGRFIT